MQILKNFLIIYSFPGKLLAEFWYLWSKKGQLWASSRRRNHGFVHFVYATGIYAFLFLALPMFWVILTSVKSGSAHSAAISTSGTGYENGEKKGVAGGQGNNQEIFSSRSDPEGAQATVETQASADPEGEGIAVKIGELESKLELSNSQIAAAMSEAFQSGSAVRAEENGVGGYAVASEPSPESGCRSVHFTYDGESQPRRKDSICP